MAHKTLVAMSGGVDSSVAAQQLLQNGYDCLGAIMLLADDAADQVRDARSVCSRLGIELQVLDMRESFRQHVMAEFVRAYESGLTPNPCIVCNKKLKFGLLWEAAQALGCTHLATGHYARITEEEGRFWLSKAPDEAKDQSYFLYGIPHTLLPHLLFPLGELSKAQVRQLAEDHGLVNARKKDSQDICFVPDGDYMTFLRSFTGKEYAPGPFLGPDGTVVGQHKGAVAYTVGQRKGLGIALGQPMYVCGKNMADNSVTVGPNEALFHTTLIASDWNWLCDEPTAPLRCAAKARSRMHEQPATVTPLKSGQWQVEFDEPQRALTPGQAVVLYAGSRVLGGGTIAEIL